MAQKGPKITISSPSKKTFPGDTFKLVTIVLPDGRSLPVFGIWKETKRGETWYENDTNGKTFKTIDDVKKYAAQFAKQKYPEIEMLGEGNMEIDKRLDLFLTERRMTTKVEMTKAERELKLAKAKDVGLDLYPDFTKFLAVYLNSLKGKELNNYRVINREKAAELVRSVASSHPNMQAVLDKLHLDPEAFVTRFWSKMDMKTAIQDAVAMLLKGEQGVVVRTAKESKEEEPVVEAKETKHTNHKKVMGKK